MNGIIIQRKINKRPAKNIKIWAIIPIEIKKILIMKPIILAKTLEIKTLKNSPMSKPLGYLQLYLRHGETKVKRRFGIEKKYKLNQRKFCQTKNKSLGAS